MPDGFREMLSGRELRDLVEFLAGLKYALGILQAEKLVSGWGTNEHLIFAANDNRNIRDSGPPRRIIDDRILLQRKSCGWRRPGDDNGICRSVEDSQQRRARQLDSRDDAPKTAVNCVGSAAHVSGVGLADGAADAIKAAGAGATAAINRVPINGIGLGLNRGGT
jgi:hypothetical protein